MKSIRSNSGQEGVELERFRFAYILEQFCQSRNTQLGSSKEHLHAVRIHPSHSYTSARIDESSDVFGFLLVLAFSFVIEERREAYE